MPSSLQEIAATPGLLSTLQFIAILQSAIVGGLSLCLSAWIIPIIFQAPTSKLRITQFNLLIAKGVAYLMPMSRIFAAALTILTYLISQHPDPQTAETWRQWAVAVLTFIPAIPGEMYFIFPMNERMAEIGRELEKKGEEELSAPGKVEVERLLRSWQVRNLGRAALSTMVAGLGLRIVMSQR